MNLIARGFVPPEGDQSGMARVKKLKGSLNFLIQSAEGGGKKWWVYIFPF